MRLRRAMPALAALAIAVLGASAVLADDPPALECTFAASSRA